MPPPVKAKAASAKRRPERDPSISPPPIKRKAQSSVSKGAVASFFTPASQKPKDRTIWTERAPNEDTPPTLLVAKYEPATAPSGEPPAKRRKIAAFDLDSTLISTATGKKHADGPGDWKWWDSAVPERLRELYNEEGFRLVIFTNQGGLTLHPDPKAKAPKKDQKERVANFKQKCNAVLAQLDLPLTLYAATGKDIYRKPRTGMWTEMCDDWDLAEADIDLEHSIFVGDAGGRTPEVRGKKTIPKDFSCGDRNFAHNVGIPYQTPEEFFLGDKPRDFAREFDLQHYPYATEGQNREADASPLEKLGDKEIILFCGPPGAGKSTFYRTHLKPLGYERVNQDTLKTKEKCFKAATELLQEGKSVAIDNTNPDPDTRGKWVELARKNKVRIRCVWFKTPLSLCEHNDAVRALNKTMNPESRESLPKLAFNSFGARFKEPKVKEGFHDVIEVDFQFRGTEEEYAVWGRYWV